MSRPSHIPHKVWLAAKGVAVRFADDAEVVRMAEMIMRRQRGEAEVANQDRVTFWPGMTKRECRVVRDALFEYETVIDDDVSALFRMRSVFDAEAQARGELTGARE